MTHSSLTNRSQRNQALAGFRRDRRERILRLAGISALGTIFRGRMHTNAVRMPFVDRGPTHRRSRRRRVRT